MVLEVEIESKKGSEPLFQLLWKLSLKRFLKLKFRPDGFSKILTEDADHGADEEDDGAAFVVQLEDPVVNISLFKL